MTRPRFQDLACPRCGHRGDFHIDITATAYVDASGPTVESDYYWDEGSDCSCLECYFGGSVADFVAKKSEVTP
jgi:hypothetical protein